MSAADTIRPLMVLAAKELPCLPVPERIALYEAVAVALAGIEPAASSKAKSAAEALRQAETSQITFANLFQP